MANMAYCRFQNTLLALKDCYNNIDDKSLSDEEKDARHELISLCKKITTFDMKQEIEQNLKDRMDKPAINKGPRPR